MAKPIFPIPERFSPSRFGMIDKPDRIPESSASIAAWIIAPSTKWPTMLEKAGYDFAPTHVDPAVSGKSIGPASIEDCVGLRDFFRTRRAAGAPLAVKVGETKGWPDRLAAAVWIRDAGKRRPAFAVWLWERQKDGATRMQLIGPPVDRIAAIAARIGADPKRHEVFPPCS